MSFLEKIISCKNDGVYRVITIFGIRFKRKNARREIMAELNSLRSRLDILDKNIKAIAKNNEKEIKTLTMSANQKLDHLRKLVDGQGMKISQFWETGYAPLKYYKNEFECGFLKPFFAYMERPDFAEKYLALINGLSDRDVREINKILWRVNFIKTHPEQKLFNFYSPEEQAKKIKIVTELNNKIIAVSNNLYVYDQYKLPINHFETCVFLYRHGIDLVKDKAALRNKDFIDAGAYIGDSALVLSEYTDKRIYSFEINPENIKNLRQTIELNNLTRVTVVEKALYDSEMEMELNLHGSASSLDKLPGIAYEEKTVTVPTVTLDKFVRENNLRIGLIKTDLEGAELNFLKGAEQTIREQKPVLLLSVYHKPSDFFELKPLLEDWVPDYEFTVFNPVDDSIFTETMIVAQSKEGID